MAIFRTGTIWAILALFIAVIAAEKKPDAQDDALWETYKRTFNKTYSEKAEELLRRVIFQKNVRYINRHNLEADLGKHSFRLGINHFADMTNEEFRRAVNGYRSRDRTEKRGSTFLPFDKRVKLPDEVDWRKEGLVTKIKNQGICGSCWAFSATGSLEGQYIKKTGNQVLLSEQNLVDCSQKEGNKGCSGGLMDQAFQYIIDNKGIDTEESYPYIGWESGKCRFKPDSIGATITGFSDIPAGDEKALQQAVATVGPISVAIDASSLNFQFYRSGVYDNPSCSTTDLDHGVLVVGYGKDGDTDYWLVKNSWGLFWGNKGYINMSRNKSNQCGIASQASYPLL